MIPLGSISLKRSTAIQEARAKVRAVTERLTDDPVVAIRVATAVSEMARRFVRGGVDPAVTLAIDTERSPALKLAFLDSGDFPPTEFLSPFFARVEPIRSAADGRKELVVTWPLPQIDLSDAQVRGLLFACWWNRNRATNWSVSFRKRTSSFSAPSRTCKGRQRPRSEWRASSTSVATSR